MAQSVSNDALWEKLLEIDKKIDKSVPEQEQVDITAEIKSLKNEILVELEMRANLLGTHSQSHFDANRQNIIALGDNVRKVWNIVARIRKQQKETVEIQTENKKEQQLKTLETQTKDNYEYFNLQFFKFRKVSFIMAILGLLVFILTAFCMKQQNDYLLLIDEYYRQEMTIKEMHVE